MSTVEAAAERRAKPQTAEEVMRRWPRLVAHMICESLGYHTPRSAAMALLRHTQGEQYPCEYYGACGDSRQYDHLREYEEHDGRRYLTRESHHAVMLQVGRDRIQWAFKGRNRHRGYMADYGQAIALVRASVAGKGEPMLASWF